MDVAKAAVARPVGNDGEVHNVAINLHRASREAAEHVLDIVVAVVGAAEGGVGPRRAADRKTSAAAPTEHQIAYAGRGAALRSICPRLRRAVRPVLRPHDHRKYLARAVPGQGTAAQVGLGPTCACLQSTAATALGLAVD